MSLRALVALAALFAFSSTALALDPAQHLTQYGHTAWRVRDGSFAAPPTAIAQTTDGYLWIGSEAGLLRFDGIRFEQWNTSQLPDQRVIGLLGTRDGSLWIGTLGGLAQLKNGKLTVRARAGRFSALTEDAHGVVWAGHTRALSVLPPLCRYDRDGFKCLEKSAAMPFDYVGALHRDSSGDIWIGGNLGVCRRSAVGEACYPIPALAGIANKVGVFQLTTDAAQGVWASAGSKGLWHLESGNWKLEPLLTDHSIDEAPALFTDRSGAVWIGTQSDGLFRRSAGRTDRFEHIDGLTSDNVSAIFEDSEGDVWIATTEGLDRLRDLKVATLSKSEGLPGGNVVSVVAARDGSVWVALQHDLAQLKNEKITLFRSQHLQGNGPTSLFEDSRGRLILGVDDGLRIFDGSRFSRVAMRDGSPIGVVTGIAEDRDHNLWISTAPVTAAGSPLLRLRDDAVVEAFSRERIGSNLSAMAADPSGGIWFVNSTGDILHFNDGLLRKTGNVRDVRNMFVDAQGVWLATKHGVIRMVDGKFHALTTRSGLPCDDIESAITGQRGSLWLKTSCGVERIPADDIQAWIANPIARVRPRVFDAVDGARAGLPPFSPRSAVSKDGRVWFASETSGLQVLRPQALDERPSVPAPRIVRIIADQNQYDLLSAVRFPALTKNVEIDYTASTLAFPERVRFRYRLEGAGSEWHDVGTRREAYFNNLDPGHYRFEVVAGNQDGTWNRVPATLNLSILPAFYQTNAFLTLCILSLAGLMAVIYQWRVHYVRRGLLRNFEERLDERTRIARELHDTLLQGFLSSSLQLQVAMESLPVDSPVLGPLQRVNQLMRQVIDDGRASLRNLRASFGGVDDLERSISHIPTDLGIPNGAAFRIVVNGQSRRLRAVVRDEIYRVAREAVVNAYKHAQAKTIEVELEYTPRQLRVLVRDDGRGIGQDVLHIGREGHWGLVGMRERAETIGAHLTVRSREHSGTEVELIIPNEIGFEQSRKSKSR